MDNATILCVEDEPDIRALVMEELTDAGFNVLEAENGKAGLDAIVAHKPDLVICDINMPIMTGPDLLKHLRTEHTELEEMSFMFLSAQSEHQLITDSDSEVSADDYLLKPIDFDMMIAKVQAQLRRQDRLRARKEEELAKLYKHFTGDQSSAAPEPKKQDKTQAFQDSVRSQVTENGGKLTAGKLQVVGLSDIKTRLGSQWETAAEEVMGLAERALRARLGPKDSFVKSDELQFLLTFGEASAEDAWRIAQEIERDLSDSILNSDAIAKAQAAKNGAPENDAFGGVTSEVRSIKVKPEDLDKGEDILDFIAGKMEAATRQVKENMKILLADIKENYKTSARPVMKQNGTTATFKILEFDQATRAKVERVTSTADCDPEELAKLDMLILADASERIANLPSNDKTLLAIPVWFNTLYHRQSAAQYLKLSRTLGNGISRRMALMIRDLPREPNPKLLVNLASRLSEISTFQIVQIDHPDSQGAFAVNNKILVASIDYPRLKNKLIRNPAALKKMMQAIRTSGTRILINQVPKRDGAGSLKGLPFDFFAFSGDVI